MFVDFDFSQNGLSDRLVFDLILKIKNGLWVLRQYFFEKRFCFGKKRQLKTTNFARVCTKNEDIYQKSAAYAPTDYPLSSK